MTDTMPNPDTRAVVTAQVLAERFCAATLPDSVCSDRCAGTQGPNRHGTNLLTVAEARAIFESILPAITEPRADTVAFVQEWMMSGDHDPTQWDRDFAAAIDARLAEQTECEARVEALEKALREIWLEASETIPPDGKDAAFHALGVVMRTARAALQVEGAES